MQATGIDQDAELEVLDARLSKWKQRIASISGDIEYTEAESNEDCLEVMATHTIRLDVGDDCPDWADMPPGLNKWRSEVNRH